MSIPSYSEHALNQHVAVITGAQQGIGFATARAMAQAGACVVVNWFDDGDAAMSLAEEFNQGDATRIVPVHGSVTNETDIEAMFTAADEFGLGGASILVNNAAVFPRVPFLEMTDQDWDSLMDINLKGSFRCARAFAKRIAKSPRPGEGRFSMINLTSGAAFRSSPRGVHYVTSKAGIVGMTRALSLELAELGIRVNAIAPGLVDTAQPRFGMTEDELIVAGTENPMGRIADPEDIAAMAVFLSTNAARHVTGQTLHVNGGQYLY